MTLSAALVQGYLQRLGLTHAPRPSMDSLSSLLQAHVARIPYGNLDIHSGSSISSLQQPMDAAASRLLSRRGGYCFHLAPPFCALLRTLGFDANIFRGQVVNHPGSSPEPARPNHAVVIVSNLEDAPTEMVLADVGIGDGPRSPVPLRPGLFDEAPFAYGIERLGESSWRFLHDERGGFSHFDVDCEAPAIIDDFVEPHRILSTVKESYFVQVFTVQRVDHGLIEKIVNRRYRRLTSAGTSEVPIDSEQHLGELLRGRFELSVPPADRSAIWRWLLAREDQERCKERGCL